MSKQYPCFFVNQNNLTDLIFSELPDLDPNDGSIIESYIYSSTSSNNEIWLYKVIDGEHDWPGAWGNMDVNISQEIWRFFSEMSILEGSFVEEFNTSSKKLIQVIDILGRQNPETNFQLNIYDNGSVEKKYLIKN